MTRKDDGVVLQRLWGGYGVIKRVTSANGETFIVKHVAPPSYEKGTLSHDRRYGQGTVV